MFEKIKSVMSKIIVFVLIFVFISCLLIGVFFSFKFISYNKELYLKNEDKEFLKAVKIVTEPYENTDRVKQIEDIEKVKKVFKNESLTEYLEKEINSETIEEKMIFQKFKQQSFEEHISDVVLSIKAFGILFFIALLINSVLFLWFIMCFLD